MSKKLKFISFLFFPLSLFINYISSKFPYYIEEYYSQKLNKIIIQLLSNISSLLPFSLYEVCMYLIAFSCILFLISFIYITINYPNKIKFFLSNSILNILSFLCVAYFFFTILWGLNYNRIPLETTIINNFNIKTNSNFSTPSHTTKDLENIYKYLIEKTNNTRKYVLTDDNNIMKANSDYNGIINRAKLGYDNILEIVPCIKGYYAKPKYVKSSNIMCYTGITGIYFPWTGEANINIAIPDIYIPSTVTHEMAHQRGYASEDEANLFAYLTCINHPDVDFNYSGLILALNHTASALKIYDYKTYIRLSNSISPNVLKDLENNKIFWMKYEGKMNDFSNKFNDLFLKSNGIKEGTTNYSKIVNLLITYYKIYPYN